MAFIRNDLDNFYIWMCFKV